MELQKIDKKWWFFGAALLLQFVVLFLWVVKSNDTIQQGTVYKFRLMGYDPHDPFRGEYLRIRFKDNTVDMPSDRLPSSMQGNMYVSFYEDEEGFAKPRDLSEYSSEERLRVKVITGYGSGLDSTLTTLCISYPFDYFWMNQEDCPKAEHIINQALNDGLNVCALVSIKDGEGVLMDIEVDGIDIKTMLRENYGD
ncbi:MAG: GDYXXLXY domain-containing protein [Paludibacteraceae bacterium]|nr:GDYXXLXY domain-containing protein [Paludibacteraceae bacterium]